MAVCADYGIAHSVFLEWSEADRDKALWWHIRQAEKCPGCGTRHAEWEQDRNAYKAELVRCRGCEIRQQAEASVSGDEGRGVLVALKRTNRSVGR